MLKVRIIPTLLWKNVGLVKGMSFNSWRRVGTAMPAIKVYNTRQVDELIFLDITATQEGREPDYETIEELTAECFVPMTVGGGVRSLEHVKNLLRAGADKVAINSAAYEMPDLIREAANKFGSQCIVASIDVRKQQNGKYECYSRSGTQATGIELTAWVKTVEGQGAGEILITSVELDGTMEGYDLEMLRQVTNSVQKIPVIASGGAGNYEHLNQALKESGVSAVAAASIFHFTQQTPLEAKKYLSERGVPVRNINMK